MCLDRTSLLADISLGDAWLPELKGDLQGTSIIIARTEKGLAVVNEAIKNNIIKISEVDFDTITRSQSGLWRDMANIQTTLFLAKMFHKKVPKYEITILNPGWQKIIRCIKRIVRSTVLRRMTSSDRFFAFIQRIKHLKHKTSSL